MFCALTILFFCTNVRSTRHLLARSPCVWSPAIGATVAQSEGAKVTLAAFSLAFLPLPLAGAGAAQEALAAHPDSSSRCVQLLAGLAAHPAETEEARGRPYGALTPLPRTLSPLPDSTSPLFPVFLVPQEIDHCSK